MSPHYDNEETEQLVDALYDLIAIERDRQLGYPSRELHMDPTEALQNALDALAESSNTSHPDDIVFPDDQERLGLEVEK